MIIVGTAYIIAQIFSRIPRPEAKTAAVNAPLIPRPCLELISDLGAVRDGYGRILGSVRNNCEKQFRYLEVEFKLYDSTGDVIGAAVTNQAALGPYESWEFEAVAMQPYARYQLAHITGD